MNNRVKNKKLLDIHIDGLNKWNGEKIISLYPKNGYGLQEFSMREEERYNSTEFWCAMKILDDLKVPRVNVENNQSYSIVGRIAWLTRNKVIEIPNQKEV